MTKYAKRLLKLACFLEELQPAQFRFGRWQHCAIGHASRIPTFHRLGLRLDTSEAHRPYMVDGSDWGRILFGLGEVERWYVFAPWEDYYSALPTTRFPGDRMPDRNATPKQVAAQIRAYVEWS